MIPVIVIVIALAVYAPMLWVRWVMRRHAREIPGMPGTGGELAEHLVRELGLDGVVVERTDPLRDHYDPAAKAVRLSPSNYDGKSLTAVAVAAHEVGHAMQHRDGSALLEARTKLAPLVAMIESGAGLLLVLVPIVTVGSRSPIGLGLSVAAVASMFVARLAMHAFTLPTEWDASFRRALPVLENGRYVAPGEERAVRSVLRAAALTYVASALADILSFWRWLPIILRR